MDSIATADNTLSKLTDVRIVYLPPTTVAASQYIGPEPETHAGQIINRFVKESGLCRIKPDLRHFGFNNPCPPPGCNNVEYGYEMWVTIPEDMDVPAPLEKKHFAGGLYAAHMIALGQFEQWEWLGRWVGESEVYEYDPSRAAPEVMGGLLEECLNYIHHLEKENDEFDLEVQLDLLFPIRPRKKD